MKDIQVKLNENSNPLKFSRIYLENVLKADEIAGLLQQEGLKVEAWTERFGNFFRAVSIEKNLLLVVMLLVIAIASTGIISALTILIEDKKNEVAILRTIGLRSSQIASIFLFFGFEKLFLYS